METINSLKKWIQLVWLKILKYKTDISQSINREKIAFGNHYIETRNLYVNRFNRQPNIAEITDVKLSAVFDLIKSNKYGKVKSIFQSNEYNWGKNEIEYDKTIFILDHKMMISLSYDDVIIYYQNSQFERVKKIIDEFKNHKAECKEVDYEINIISLNGNSLELKTINITPTELDLDLYYNDDFKAVDATIKERLGREKDKGIVLLHGLPGTGKTTYLRHLIGSLKKKVMFVSPSVASNLMNPEFMDLLIDNPNSILVIEDAENIIMDRRFSSQSSVSNLLNISDGLLSDCLNVQIICTFNSELSFVDSALMRKGRLIAKYEFGKLDVAKANKLSNHLGLLNEITKPMTLAEITNPDDNHYEAKQHTVIGFRREMVLEN
ncbi:MAG: AAA family ATPase [Chitinophagaceae bacterium]